MANIIGAIQNTIPISLFNRGQAGKIFDEVRRYGAKVVMKNNSAECVLLSPEEYVSLMDEVNDARLLTIASERMAAFNPNTLVSQDEVDREFGFTAEDLDSIEVDIE
ncbi:MAG: type II toxin-antitoxin system Phd/YefM family antitoxin [Lachnospiraceae bacterium]|nr:type II toxin-antitoxin system Phd/YefM family antitoxin [Lachnospiraceae bacterium]MCD7832534.1 type II toxin-antitoxin system Phd/YefM family antitoxin [Lachnospiraceae bacterium]